MIARVVLRFLVFLPPAQRRRFVLFGCVLVLGCYIGSVVRRVFLLFYVWEFCCRCLRQTRKEKKKSVLVEAVSI